VLARARHEGQEAFDELERGEHDGLGPVGEWALEPQGDAPVGEQGQPVSGDGRPSEISCEVLEAIAGVQGV
jgi:hypothetical protein